MSPARDAPGARALQAFLLLVLDKVPTPPVITATAAAAVTATATVTATITATATVTAAVE